MGRNGGRDEDDLIQLECLPDLFGTPEVTEMDGVEGPSKQPNFSTFGLLLYFSILPYLES